MLAATRTKALSKMPWILVLLGVIFVQIRGDGVVHVGLVLYDNPDGKGDNGHCCDGRWSICQQDGCDHYFTVCLDNTRQSSSIVDCLLGSVLTGVEYGSNDILFGDDIGGVENPLTFPFQGSFPEAVVIKVEVWDKDHFTGDDYVDFLSEAVTLEQGRPLLLELEARTRLVMDVTLECTNDFYGDKCSRQCSRPGADDNYICDVTTGDKICLDGWTGADCDVRVTTTSSTAASTSTTTTTVSTTTTGPTTSEAGVVFVDRENADCDNLALNGHAYQDGTYTLRVGHFDPFLAYCDMGSQGWTVIQRRLDGSEDFNRSWQDYKHGFGEVDWDTEYWIGLEKIYWLTNQRPCSLRVTMQLANLEFRFAEYEHFWIENEAGNYTLHVSGYSGTAGDALRNRELRGMRYHNNAPFSTSDSDHDGWNDGNCAQSYTSGWWFNDCYWCNLNGQYRSQQLGWPPCEDGACISWRSIEGYEDFSLVRTEMEILPTYRLD